MKAPEDAEVCCPLAERWNEHLSDEELIGYLMLQEHAYGCAECSRKVARLSRADKIWQSPKAERRRLELMERVKEAVSRYEPGQTSPPRLRVVEEPAVGPGPVDSTGDPGSVEVAGLPVPLLRGEHLIAIDFGSSTVRVLIGRRDESGVEIVGKGSAPHRGHRCGAIGDRAAALKALELARKEAEVMSGVDAYRVSVGVGGVGLWSAGVHGKITLAHTAREITAEDIQNVLDRATSAAPTAERQIIGRLVQEFIVDEQPGIDDPLGMLGTRLEVLVHLVTADADQYRELLTCVLQSGFSEAEVIFEPLAAAEAVLEPDERELGVLLVDIGEATTEYALFAEGRVQHSGVLPVAARHFTQDLSVVLRIPLAEAEQIKVRYGTCLPSMNPDEAGIEAPMTGGGLRKVFPSEICEILRPRAEELLRMLRKDLLRHAPDSTLRGGVVLTGAGALLGGLRELTAQVFDAEARHGRPQGLGGLADELNHPAWSTAAGLLLSAAAGEGERVQRRPGRGMRALMGGLRDVLFH